MDVQILSYCATAGLTVGAFVLALDGRKWRNKAKELRSFLRQAEVHVGNLQRALSDAYDDVDLKHKQALELAGRLQEIRQKALEDDRARREAVRLRRERMEARAAERAALKDADAQARRRQTVQSLSNTIFRPRAEVVAEVRSRRSI